MIIIIIGVFTVLFNWNIQGSCGVCTIVRFSMVFRRQMEANNNKGLGENEIETR